MQRKFVTLSMVTVLSAIGAAWVVTANDIVIPTAESRIQKRILPVKPVVNGRIPAVPPPPGTAVSENTSVRLVSDAIAQAYLQHDAKAFAAVFTADGEYVDLKEILFHGRENIEKEFIAFFQTNPNSIVKVSFDEIRPIAKGVVQVQGAIHFQRTSADQAVTSPCRLVCVKEVDRWLIASLREIESQGKVSPHHEQVSQLKWMLGDWLHEGPRSEIHFDCRWDQSGNFLLRDFSVRAAGRKSISGTQRIGHDPLSGHLKIWTFDSDGGYSDGTFQQQGATWILRTQGVTADGQLASGTEIFTVADPHRIVWDSVDRNVGGHRIPDSNKITIVRKPPTPTASSSSLQPSK
jgi:uncharacterized protein (TIGR02246 family)